MGLVLRVVVGAIVGIAAALLMLWLFADCQHRQDGDASSAFMQPAVAAAPEAASPDSVANASADPLEGRARPIPAYAGPTGWNTSDPDPATSGNMAYALELFKTGAPLPKGIKGNAAQTLQHPWKFYGQRLCFHGDVAGITDVPPGSDEADVMGGQGAEILILTPDNVFVDTIWVGDTKNLKQDDKLEICGLPVGREDVVNKLGGTFTNLMMVGHE